MKNSRLTGLEYVISQVSHRQGSKSPSPCLGHCRKKIKTDPPKKNQNPRSGILSLSLLLHANPIRIPWRNRDRVSRDGFECISLLFSLGFQEITCKGLSNKASGQLSFPALELQGNATVTVDRRPGHFLYPL